MAKRIYGADAPILKCTNPYMDKWQVTWKYEEGEDTYAVGTVFTHKPSIEEIKEEAESYINDKVKDIIYKGFKVDDNIVYLSIENLFNYKAAYDLAVLTNGSNLPVTFKFGEDYYKTFNTVKSLEEFYKAMLTHINSAISKGWELKLNIDYNFYKDKLLNEETHSDNV